MELLISTGFGNFGRKIRQICQLSSSFIKKTQLEDFSLNLLENEPVYITLRPIYWMTTPLLMLLEQ